MKLIKPSYEILTKLDSSILERIEAAGRISHKTEENIRPGTSIKFCDHLIRLGHESVLEHESISIKFIVDRGFLIELRTHRIASFTAESTRYCNYSGGATFIIPPWMNISEGEYSISLLPEYITKQELIENIWFQSMLDAELAYLALLDSGWTPQQARSVLPNSLKTEIVCTANIREWKHILRLRTSKAAHPQMREIMCPLLDALKQLPVLFEDINYD